MCQAIKDVNGLMLRKEVEKSNRGNKYFEGLVNKSNEYEERD